MSTNNSERVGICTVRELGGEIWSEISKRIAEENINWKWKSKVVDIVMGVLARHEGEVLANDRDLPVAPLDGSRC